MLCIRLICVLAFCAVATAHTRTNEWSTAGASYSYGGEERVLGEPYTLANINVTYEDEHGEIYSETSEVGKYGEGYVGSSYGVIVHVRSVHDSEDHSGCSWPLVSREEMPDEPWIALVKRGKCNFEIKVQNAWRSNASAILVYNDRDSSSLDKMRLNSDRNRNMSSVFTYKWKGEEIARLVDNGTRVMVAITPGRECIRQYNNINRTSVLFVSISFIVLMIISLAWLVFYYIQRFRYIHAKDRLSKRLCNAAKKALSKIPVKNLKSEDKEVVGDGECCAVCIEPYKISDILRSLPCRHEFHKSCIDPWLLEHRTCPMCKMDILKYYGFVFTGSQESILQMEAGPGRARPARTAPDQLTREPSFVEPNSERSSRASSPDEFTPTLPPAHEAVGGVGASKSRSTCKAAQVAARRCSSSNATDGAPGNSGSVVRIDMTTENQD